jgi:hypothetical protein
MSEELAVSALAFLLSHHRPEEYDRCYRVGPLRLCARCSGLYPTLAVMLVLQHCGFLGEPRLEWVLLYLLPLPALWSWARRRLWGIPGSNPMATCTGVMLGIALGRGLYRHLVNPCSPQILLQFLGLAASVVTVELLRRRRRA